MRRLHLRPKWEKSCRAGGLVGTFWRRRWILLQRGAVRQALPLAATLLEMWPGSGPTRNTRRRHYRCSVPGLAGFVGQALCGARSLINFQEPLMREAAHAFSPQKTLTRRARVGKRAASDCGVNLRVDFRAVCNWRRPTRGRGRSVPPAVAGGRLAESPPLPRGVLTCPTAHRSHSNANRDNLTRLR